jgi:ABC-type proline/glycine betaine transport system permease subunit
MENNVSKFTISFGLALVLAAVTNAILVIMKESSPAVQAWMQRLTGHHWITHSALVLAVFFFFGLTLARESRRTLTSRLIVAVGVGIAVASLAIMAFYLVA